MTAFSYSFKMVSRFENVTDYEPNLSLMILTANQKVYSWNKSLKGWEMIIWFWTKPKRNYSVISLFIIDYSYKEDNENSNSDKLECGFVKTVTGTAKPGGLGELSFPNFKQRIKNN